MQKLTGTLLGMCLLFGGFSIASAQEMAEGVTPPPKVLVISREFVKPGKTGMVHEKSESAFVQAMAKAKWPTHYLAVSSMSGRSRVLFLTGYDSFEAWEKDNHAVEKNKTLLTALDHALVADGDLLTDFDQTVATYSEEYSLRPNVDIAHMRYFEVSLFQVKPGHRKEWGEIVKLVMAAYKNIPDAHWATYEVAYGQQGNATYVVFSALKSATEIDHAFTEDKDFVAAMGEEGMKKLSDLESSAMESSQTNLFAFSPSMSYAPDEWVKADPEFWKPKTAPGAAPKKPAEEKPAP
jgi:hypothetical protein